MFLTGLDLICNSSSTEFQNPASLIELFLFISWNLYSKPKIFCGHIGLPNGEIGIGSLSGSKVPIQYNKLQLLLEV